MTALCTKVHRAVKFLEDFQLHYPPASCSDRAAQIKRNHFIFYRYWTALFL